MGWIDIFDPNFRYPDPPKSFGSLKVVFSGTPRGGTTFISDLLRTLGVPHVGHEVVFRSQGAVVAENLRVDVSGFAWPYLPVLDVRHYFLVRHPVKAINSIVDYFPYLFEQEGSWRKAEVFWYRAFVRAEPSEVLRVEDTPSWLPDIGWTVFGEQWDADLVADRAAQVKKNECRLSRRSRVTWGELSVRVQDMAKRFGYSA